METVEKSAKPTATTDLAFNATVGVYTSHKEALHAVHKLLENGYSKESISIIGKNNFVEEVKGTYNWGDAAEEGMKVGGVAGGVLGALAGLGLIVVPGLGLIATGGIMGAMILSALTLEGAALGSIGGGALGTLLGNRLGTEGVVEYERHIDGGKYMVIVHTTADDAKAAKQLLHEETEHENVTTH
jgi:hypothetical protein